MSTRKRRAYEDTTVAAAQSQAEIRSLLLKYGVAQFGIIEEAGRAVIGFQAHGRLVRLEVPLPDMTGNALTKAGKYLRAGTAAARSVHEQEERRIWRAVRCWIFAQLEAVESGIRTFEEVFFSETVLVNGQSMAQWYGPQIEKMANSGVLPCLPGLDRPRSVAQENPR